MSGDFILRYIMTVEQKNDLVNLLENLIENIFKKDPTTNPNSSFEKKALEIIYFEIERRKIQNDPEKIEDFLKKVLDEAKAMSVLKLTIAIPPSESLIEKLKDWAEANKFINMVFDIEVKPDLIAGAIIVTKEGKYIKYSLSEMLDYYFMSKKLELSALL